MADDAIGIRDTERADAGQRSAGGRQDRLPLGGRRGGSTGPLAVDRELAHRRITGDEDLADVFGQHQRHVERPLLCLVERTAPDRPEVEDGKNQDQQEDAERGRREEQLRAAIETGEGVSGTRRQGAS